MRERHRTATLAFALALGVAVPGMARAASSTFLWFPSPGIPQAFDNTTVQGVDEFWCITAASQVGITSATQFAWRVGTTSVTGTFGVALYSADGSTQLASATFSAPSANTSPTATGLTGFSLTAATLYRLCWCSSSGTGTYAGVPDSVPAFMDPYWNHGTTRLGRAANDCSTGVPPSTTGTLTASGGVIPLEIILGTDTP